jgi:hypothetical protein
MAQHESNKTACVDWLTPRYIIGEEKTMSKHIPTVPAQHRQTIPRLRRKYGHPAMKQCPSCGQLFFASDLHTAHIVSACRVIRRRERASDSVSG